MNGRVMNELLTEKSNEKKLASKKETITTSAAFPGGTHTLTLERSLVGKYEYVDYSKVVRAAK